MSYRINTSLEAALEHGADYVTRWKALPKCRDCERPMRPFKTTAEEWPATVPSAAQKLCSTHYARRIQYRKPVKESAEDLPPADPGSRRAIAEGWSETDRAVALQVCGHVSEPKEAYEVMSMLGLFEGTATPYVLDPLHAARFDRQ